MCQIFQGDRQPPLARLDAGNAADSPQIGEANSLTLRFHLSPSTSRKPVAALVVIAVDKYLLD
jgi:hypothetical protein